MILTICTACHHCLDGAMPLALALEYRVMKTGKAMVVYVAVAYLVSWLVFGALALNHHHLIYLFPDDAAHARVQDLWHALGALGPLAGAFVTLNLYYNREARQQFKQGYAVKKLTVPGWLLSLSPLLLFGLAMVAGRLVEGKWFDVGGFFRNNQLTQPANLLAWLLPIFFYGFGEEAGWRGYALPALQAKHSALGSTVILSLTWACWHIPSFFYRYQLQGFAYVGFLLGILAGATWLSFLFNYTGGSILAVSLWHLAFNFVSMLSKNERVLPAAMSVMVMVLAVFVVIKYGQQHLSPRARTRLPAEAAPRSLTHSRQGVAGAFHPDG